MRAKTRMQYAVICACVMIFPLSAYATGSNNSNLQVSVSVAICKKNFVNNYINDVILVIPSASLTQDVAKLNTDLATLQGYVNNNDVAGFTSFGENTYVPDIKSAWIDAGDTVKSANLADEKLSTLTADHRELWSTYFTCLSSSLK